MKDSLKFMAKICRWIVWCKKFPLGLNARYYIFCSSISQFSVFAAIVIVVVVICNFPFTLWRCFFFPSISHLFSPVIFIRLKVFVASCLLSYLFHFVFFFALLHIFSHPEFFSFFFMCWGGPRNHKRKWKNGFWIGPKIKCELKQKKWTETDTFVKWALLAASKWKSNTLACVPPKTFIHFRNFDANSVCIGIYMW